MIRHCNRYAPTLLFLACSFLTPVLGQDTKENADFKLAISLYNDGLYDLAAEQLRMFTNAYPNTSEGIEGKFYLGLTQEKLKRFEDARITFQTFALNYQDNPRAPEAWYHTGEAYAALNNIKEAALAFERAKMFHPKSRIAPDALLQASKYFSLINDRENARRVLRVILQEYPSSSAVMSARTQLGKMFFEEGNLDQAQNELKRVIEGDPSADARAQALLILGNIQFSSRKIEDAQANYQEIITKYKTSAAVEGALVNLGRLFASTGRQTEAVEHYKKALNWKGPSDSLLLKEALLGMAEAQSAGKDYTGAIASYDRFLTVFSSGERVPEAVWLKALAAARAKRFSASNDACQRLLHLLDKDILRKRAQILLGRNAAEQQNIAGAVQAFQLFADQYPEDAATPEVLFMIGKLCETRLFDPRKAAAAFEQISTRYTRSSFSDDALFGAARCHELLKDPERSLELDRELVVRFPASELREQIQEQITRLETFEAKDKDVGVEKLAVLIGDVVSDKDRIGLAYRLGEIYYIDMKNYEAAASQFSNAINSGMTDARFVEALYLRSRSYEFLSWKDPKYRVRAIESYQTFLQSYPADARAKDAAQSLFFLRAISPSAARAAIADLPTVRRDTAMLRLGGLQEAADSIGEALPTYETLATQMPTTASGLEAVYRAALLFDKTGQHDSAYAWSQSYITLAPGGAHVPATLKRLAEEAHRRGDHNAAVGHLRRLMNEFGYTESAAGIRLKLARELGSMGEHEEAAALYIEEIRSLDTDPLHESGAGPDVVLGLAREYHSTGRNADAKGLLLSILAQAPEPAIAGEAYALLGWIAKDEANLDAATTYFRQAEKSSPGVVLTREVAQLFYDNEKYAEAYSAYLALDHAAQSDSDHQYFEARMILSRLKNDDITGIDKQIATFQQRFKDDKPDVAAFELERGNALYRKEDYQNALRVYSDVAKRYDDTPSFSFAVYWIGKTQQALGKEADAIETLEELLKSNAAADILGRAHLALGNLYYNAEKWPESIKNYRSITDDSTADRSLLSFALSNLIETYETAGINDAALAATRRYLDAYPNADDNLDKKLKIGILYSRLGYFDQAVMHLQGLLDRAGSDLEGEIRYYIAEANYSKGDYQQAILDFLKVPYLVTKKGKIDWTANSLYMSGQSYEKMGKFEQALTMYKQITDRSGIDATFKVAAKKEIDRVRLVLKKSE